MPTSNNYRLAYLAQDPGFSSQHHIHMLTHAHTHTHTHTHTQNGPGGVAQAIEHLPCKSETLSSNLRKVIHTFLNEKTKIHSFCFRFGTRE
jgi:hypothetical protein